MLLDREFKLKCSDLNVRTIVKFLRLGKCGDDGYFYFTQKEWLELFPNDRKVKLSFKCDKCEKEYEHVSYNLKIFEGNKTYCKNCQISMIMRTKEFKELRKKIAMEKYGVDDILKAPEVRKKIDNTNIERYGVKNPLQRPEIEQKRRQTCIERYGCEVASQNEKVKNKMKETCLEKYGTECILSNKEIRKKMQDDLFEKRGVRINSQLPEAKEHMVQTNQAKYGYDYTTQVPEIREKQKQTNLAKRKEYGMSSKIARELNEIFHGILEKHFSRYALDIYLENESIDIEIDGWGHNAGVTIYKKMTQEEFNDLEHRKEDYLFYEKGIRTIRFIAPNDKFTDKTIIFNLYQKAKEMLDGNAYKTVRIYLEENNRMEHY